eukprot:gene2827-5555_t
MPKIQRKQGKRSSDAERSANRTNNDYKIESRLKKRELKKERVRVARDYKSHDEREFLSLLHTMGLRIEYIEGDGNCLFRSIADQLEGISQSHAVYRKKIVDYISDHDDHFRLFMEDDEPFPEYINRMRKDGEWGGHQELYAASQCLGIDVVVHQVGAPRFILQGLQPGLGLGSGSVCSSNSSSSSSRRRAIHISYHGEQHYNSIRLHDDTGEGPARCISLTAIAVPWMSMDVVSRTLIRCGGDVDGAIEMLINDPDICCNSSSLYNNNNDNEDQYVHENNNEKIQTETHTSQTHLIERSSSRTDLRTSTDEDVNNNNINNTDNDINTDNNNTTRTTTSISVDTTVMKEKKKEKKDKKDKGKNKDKCINSSMSVSVSVPILSKK